MLTENFNFDILTLDDFLNEGGCMMFGYDNRTALIQFFHSLSISNLFLIVPIDISQLDVTQLFTFNIHLNFRNDS